MEDFKPVGKIKEYIPEDKNEFSSQGKVKEEEFKPVGKIKNFNLYDYDVQEVDLLTGEKIPETITPQFNPQIDRKFPTPFANIKVDPLTGEKIPDTPEPKYNFWAEDHTDEEKLAEKARMNKVSAEQTRKLEEEKPIQILNKRSKDLIFELDKISKDKLSKEKYNPYEYSQQTTDPLTGEPIAGASPKQDPLTIMHKIAVDSGIVDKNTDKEKVPEIIQNIANTLRGENKNLQPNAPWGQIKEEATVKVLDTDVPWYDPLDPMNFAFGMGMEAKLGVFAGKKGLPLLKSLGKSLIDQVAPGLTDLPDLLKNQLKRKVKSFSEYFKPKIDDDVPATETIIRYLSDQLDIPIEHGNYRFKENVQGIFKTIPEIARIKAYGDIRTAAHEVGHWVSKKFDLDLGKFADELEEIATKGRDPLKEGFSEFLAKYIVDPDDAQVAAPIFYNYWKDRLTKSDAINIKKALDGTQELVAKNIRATPEERTKGMIMSKLPEEKESVTDKIRKYYEEVFDKTQPFYQVGKALGGKDLGKELQKSVIRHSGLSDIGDHFLFKGTFKYGNKEEATGKSLNEIWSQLGSEEFDAWRNWATHIHAKELEERGIVSGFKKKDIKYYTEEIPQNPKFIEISKEVSDYQNRVLEYLKDSGMLSQKGFDTIKKAYENYVPFHRFFPTTPETKYITKGVKGKGVYGTKGGGNIPIIDPAESIVKNTYLLTQIAERNRTNNLIEGLTHLEGSGKYLDRIPTKIKPTKVTKEEVLKGINPEIRDEIIEKYGDVLTQEMNIFRPDAFMPRKNVIKSYKNGEATEIVIKNPLLQQAVNHMDANDIGMFWKFLGIPSDMIKYGSVVYDPTFIMLKNPLRDNPMAAVFSDIFKGQFIPGVDFFKGVASIAKKNQAYWDSKKYMASHSSITSTGREQMQMAAEEVRSGKPNIAKDPFELVKKIGEYVEGGTRLGATEKRIKNQISRAEKNGKQLTTKQVEAIKQDAYDDVYRRITTDFSISGGNEAMRILNKITAFLNPNIQGTKRTIEAFKDNPAQSVMKAIAMYTIPSLALWNHNKDKEWYREGLQPWEKTGFYNFGIGGTPDKPAIIFKLPRNILLGYTFGSIPEMVADQLYKEDPYFFDKFKKSTTDAIAFNMLPDSVRLYVEHKTGMDFFTGQQFIDPKSEILDKETYTRQTKEISKALARQLDINPAHIEHFTRGIGGSIGKGALTAMDEVYKAANKDKIQPQVEPEKVIGDYLPRGIFSKYPYVYPGSFDTLQRNYDSINKVVNTFNHKLNSEHNTKGAMEFFRKNFGEINWAVQGNSDKPLSFEEAAKKVTANKDELKKFGQAMFINSSKEFIKKYNEHIELIYMDDNINPAAKRDEMEKLLIKRNEFVTLVNDTVNNISKKRKNESEFTPVGKVKDYK